MPNRFIGDHGLALKVILEDVQNLVVVILVLLLIVSRPMITLTKGIYVKF